MKPENLKEIFDCISLEYTSIKYIKRITKKGYSVIYYILNDFINLGLVEKMINPLNRRQYMYKIIKGINFNDVLLKYYKRGIKNG